MKENIFTSGNVVELKIKKYNNYTIRGLIIKASSCTLHILYPFCEKTYSIIKLPLKNFEDFYTLTLIDKIKVHKANIYYLLTQKKEHQKTYNKLINIIKKHVKI